jgi:uncharacterized protein YkwD
MQLGVPQNLQPFQWSDGLARAAKEHCLDMGKAGKTGHKGTNGTSFFDRIGRQGETSWFRNESLAYGSRNPKEIMASLLKNSSTK